MLVAGLVAGVAACGGIADMTDAGEAGTFTVETPSLDAQTFEVDPQDVDCRAIAGGVSAEGLPPTLLDVSLRRGESAVRFLTSSYGEDVVAHASNTAAGCEEDSYLCCARGPCLEATVHTPEVAGVGGGPECWIDVAYSNGWAVGDFDCTFDARVREPGTRVHGSFRCAIEEWTGHRDGFRSGPTHAPITDAEAAPRARSRDR